MTTFRLNLQSPNNKKHIKCAVMIAKMSFPQFYGYHCSLSLIFQVALFVSLMFIFLSLSYLFIKNILLLTK